MEGYQIVIGDHIITVFNTPNYCEQVWNKGGLIKYHGGEMNNPMFLTFNVSPLPIIYLTTK